MRSIIICFFCFFIFFFFFSSRRRHTRFKCDWSSGVCSSDLELGWDDTATDGDNVVETNGVKVFVDSNSAPYLQGSEIDYVDNNMLGAGFAIKNPNVKSSCGCGSSHPFYTPAPWIAAPSLKVQV